MKTKELNIIIDKELIKQGNHPEKVRHPIYGEMRELAMKVAESYVAGQIKKLEGKLKATAKICDIQEQQIKRLAVGFDKMSKLALNNGNCAADLLIKNMARKQQINELKKHVFHDIDCRVHDETGGICNCEVNGCDDY